MLSQYAITILILAEHKTFMMDCFQLYDTHSREEVDAEYVLDCERFPEHLAIKVNSNIFENWQSKVVTVSTPSILCFLFQHQK